MVLGIDRSSGLIYQGEGSHGASAIWPSPIITPAKFTSSSEQNIHPASLDSHSGYSEYVFREDAFDPITRIRRGRFYRRANGQSSETWFVVVSPPVHAFPSELERDRPNIARKTATTFYPYKISSDLSNATSNQTMVALGASSAFTLWVVVSIETIHTGEELVTLKARQSLGVLPDVDWEKLPDTNGLLREKFEELRNDIYRAGAESVVDRSREVATAILSTYLQSQNIAEANGKDLGELIKLLEAKVGNNLRIVRCAAEIPQRLHSRGKHAEREKRENLRPIREQDADLAVQCVGIMLCDLGWARWQ